MTSTQTRIQTLRAVIASIHTELLESQHDRDGPDPHRDGTEWAYASIMKDLEHCIGRLSARELRIREALALRAKNRALRAKMLADPANWWKTP